GWSVRLRRERRFDGRAAARRQHAACERRRGDRQRAASRRDGRHRRTAAARGWRARHDRSRRAGRRWRTRSQRARRSRQTMNLSEIFIRRPIATSLLMAAIALFGVIAYRELPVSDLPQVDYPTLNVNASLPGGYPSTMASSVASPLERQFTTIAGLDSMVSRSGSGSTG